eukprot:jgi/Ulvmu1/8741/UM047_0082.1
MEDPRRVERRAWCNRCGLPVVGKAMHFVCGVCVVKSALQKLLQSVPAAARVEAGCVAVVCNRAGRIKRQPVHPEAVLAGHTRDRVDAAVAAAAHVSQMGVVQVACRRMRVAQNACSHRRCGVRCPAMAAASDGPPCSVASDVEARLHTVLCGIAMT